MALWLVRAGGQGQYERRFLEDDRIYFQWVGAESGKLPVSEGLEPYKEYLRGVYPDRSGGSISNAAGQARRFTSTMQVGDWVVMPSKLSTTYHFGEVLGDYEFDPVDDECCHFRSVRWLAREVPRSRVDQDIRYSLGATMSVAQISRHKAEERIRAMAESDWGVSPRARLISSGASSPEPEAQDPDEEALGDEVVNLAERAREEISEHLSRKFKGDQLEALVKAVLEAEGYYVRDIVKGSDGGVDLLAGRGDLGFDNPKIAVEVKSGDEPVGREVLDKLLGVMDRLKCDHGLLVSLSGFKSTLEGKDGNADFFKVRLWKEDDLLERIYRNYDKLPAEIRADLPLQQIWILRPETD